METTKAADKVTEGREQLDSLPEEGIFDQSLKGTKKQAREQLGSAPGGGALSANALGQRQGQHADTLMGSVAGKGPETGTENSQGVRCCRQNNDPKMAPSKSLEPVTRILFYYSSVFNSFDFCPHLYYFLCSACFGLIFI